MHILSIGKIIKHPMLKIDSIMLSELTCKSDVSAYDYIIITGGDGSIRRVLKALQHSKALPTFIINPTGSFNVIAKMHKVPKLENVLEHLVQNRPLQTHSQNVYSLNDEVFLFSAGNMGDLQHIFLSETLRFGLLEKGIAKYILSVLFLFPVHLFMTPFMLLSKKRFFIFTPLSFIKKIGSFYGEVQEMNIDLNNAHNFIELDGDVVTITSPILHINTLTTIDIVNIREG
ncbi:MAG: acylglycerol kinase family protein [Sulfurovum sp.]|nr:acylglycerol kinase family protein [Sulfurovum sp.]